MHWGFNLLSVVSHPPLWIMDLQRSHTHTFRLKTRPQNLELGVWLGRATKGPPTPNVCSSPAGLLIHQFGRTFLSISTQFGKIFQTPVKGKSRYPTQPTQESKVIKTGGRRPPTVKLMHLLHSYVSPPIPRKPWPLLFHTNNTDNFMVVDQRGHKCKGGQHRYSWKPEGLFCSHSVFKNLGLEEAGCGNGEVKAESHPSSMTSLSPFPSLYYQLQHPF